MNGISMNQKIEYIFIKKLVLWTENPRDPICSTATDQNVVDRAIADADSKWNLARLVREMGEYYDYSELPTVVYHDEKPVVYDGNRRIILGKIKHGFVSAKNFDIDNIPEFPDSIPCNVCSKDVALKNIFRKHADTGSWLPLERDIFINKHMNKEKTHFLLMEENTGIISRNPHLNQRFVKEEIFRQDILEKLGFLFDGESLLIKHSRQDADAILMDLSKKIRDKEISTRKNRGKVLEILDPLNQEKIDENKDATPHPFEKMVTATNSGAPGTTRKRSQRTKTKQDDLFGGPLYLKIGPVSNLYRDIVDLYKFYTQKKESLSDTFPSLIRMALRLLCETAAKDSPQKLDEYIRSRFGSAKNKLNQNQRTTLSNQNVTETSIIQLLHTGAHNYSSASNMEQTIAISLVLGNILTESHGKAP